MIAVPQRLEHLVGEPEVHDVLHRLLPQEMVDPEDLVLADHLEQLAVELARRSEVVSERLLDHHPRTVGEVGFRQSSDDGPEQGRRGLEVEQRMLRRAQRLAETVERRGVVRVALDVPEACEEPAESLLLRGPLFLDRGAGVCAEVGVGPLGPPAADHRHLEQHAPLQPVERWERLSTRQVSRDPEDHQGVGWASVGHFARDPPAP